MAISKELKKRIEERLGSPLTYSADCDRLAMAIEEATGERLGVTTIKRMFDLSIPAIQIERRIDEISQIVEDRLHDRLDEFGVKMKHIDLDAIEIDKDSEAYLKVRALTGGITAKTMQAQADLSIENMQQTQRLNSRNLEETLRIQREEAQRAQKLQTEQNFIGAHALNQQTTVLQTAAGNLGQMGAVSNGQTAGGMNPAGVLTSMMMGEQWALRWPEW